MTRRLIIITSALSLALVGGAGLADAGQRTRGGGGTAAGRAAPRAAGAVGVPRVGAARVGVGVAPYYRPYYYPGYYPRFAFGIYAGYPYGFYPYGFYPGYYPYGYYGGYGYAYGGYGYGYGYGYPGATYGGVRITDAPKDAGVYADGYYVGTVDDFDGTFQHVNLEAGPHHIEIRPKTGQPPVSFDVNVLPGETIRYRAYP